MSRRRGLLDACMVVAAVRRRRLAHGVGPCRRSFGVPPAGQASVDGECPERDMNGPFQQEEFGSPFSRHPDIGRDDFEECIAVLCRECRVIHLKSDNLISLDLQIEIDFENSFVPIVGHAIVSEPHLFDSPNVLAVVSEFLVEPSGDDLGGPIHVKPRRLRVPSGRGLRHCLSAGRIQSRGSDHGRLESRPGNRQSGRQAGRRHEARLQVFNE